VTGIQDIPFNYIPKEWTPQFHKEFVRDVLRFLDVRNAVGIGISISGESNETATLENDTLDNSFIVLAANPNLDNERILDVEAGVLTLTDNGAGFTVEIGVAANGIVFAKIQQIATARFVGRTTAGTGDAEELTGTQATTLLDLATTLLQGVVKQTANVADLNQTISDPPTQTQVQNIDDKVDEILAALQTSGQMA
jgi:hypothetical protein